MLSYNPSENEMQYEHSYGGQRMDFYLPPPLLPPPVVGDWYQSGLHSYMNTPTSSASPISYHFPPASSYGSSTGPLRSYTTTPLSSTSSLVPRNNLSSHSRTLQRRLSEIQSSRHQNFIQETPEIPKQKADKSQRSCMSCFQEKSKCLGDDPHRCTNCLGSTFYCKGSIMTPQLLDLDSLYQRAALALRHQSQGFFSASGSLTVNLSLRPLPNSIAAPKEEIFEFTLVDFTVPKLMEDYRHGWDGTRFDDVLDALVAVRPAKIEPKPLYDLTLFKRLSRRFCHCVTILRCLDQCTLFSDNIDQPTATHLVIGFICQLSRSANTLLASIFEEVRACCSAKRQREPTKRLMFDLTDHLGEMCKEIGALNDTLLFSEHPFLSHGFFFNAAKSLEDIENIARGLRVGGFNFANRSAPLQFGGLQVTLPTNLALVPEPGFEPPTAEASFLEVLGNSTRPVPVSDNQARLAAVTNSSFDDGIASDIVDWEAEAHASLNPGWSLQSSAFTSMPNDPKLGVPPQNQPDLTMFESSHFGPSADEGLDLFSRYASPVLTSTEESTTMSFSDVTYSHQNNTLSGNRTDSADFTEFEKPDQAAAPKGRIIQRPSKRRRMSSLLSRKKQCVSPSQLTEAEGNANADTQRTSQGQTRPNTEAPSALAQIARNIAKVKRFSNLRTPRIIKTDWVASWDNNGAKECETVDAGIVRDVNVPKHSRRPVSWPLRHHFRNSLDMSVAALGKLRIDSVSGL